MRTKSYVGVKVNTYTREVFRCPETPTEYGFSHIYAYVIGPFRTRRGAEFMAQYGANNPHIQCVADAEQLAAREPSNNCDCVCHWDGDVQSNIGNVCSRCEGQQCRY